MPFLADILRRRNNIWQFLSTKMVFVCFSITKYPVYICLVVKTIPTNTQCYIQWYIVTKTIQITIFLFLGVYLFVYKHLMKMKDSSHENTSKGLLKVQNTQKKTDNFRILLNLNLAKTEQHTTNKFPQLYWKIKICFG